MAYQRFGGRFWCRVVLGCAASAICVSQRWNPDSGVTSGIALRLLHGHTLICERREEVGRAIESGTRQESKMLVDGLG